MGGDGEGEEQLLASAFTTVHQLFSRLSMATATEGSAPAPPHSRMEDKKSYAGMGHPQNLVVELGNLALSIHKKAMTDKVAKIKESAASCKAVNLKCRKKSTIPQLRVNKTGNLCLFLLVILLSTSHVASKTNKERDEIGSCRFDMMSLSSLSCVEPGGIWRPPSMACCSALLNAVDSLPTSSDSGACCLCRYISRRYSDFGLAASYVICKGKDSPIVTGWASIPRLCHQACRARNNPYPAHKDFPVVNIHGTGSSSFRMLCIAAAAAAFSAILLMLFCYHWWRKRAANSFESGPLNLQSRGLARETRGESWPSGRRLSAHRRTSTSKNSANG